MHLLALSAFSSALFLPLIGKGFVHDDFVWLYLASSESGWYGLTHPIQLFYTPLTWLTFKADWLLWGLSPFPIALENLALHITNTLLLYWLALRLWRSHIAAWWTGFGFALFYMANSWAVMWIAARPHLLTTLFCLAAMHASVAYVRREGRGMAAMGAIISCVALSMLAKEIGVASVAVVAIMLFYAERAERPSGHRRPHIILVGALLVMLSAYLMLRGGVGAVSILSNQGWYHYTLEFKVLFSNLLEYVSRTYLIAGVLLGAIALSQYMRGARPNLKGAAAAREIGLSVALFAATLAPVVLIRGRSGLYTYLPGMAPALLLGATASALCASSPRAHRRRARVSLLPVVVVVVGLSIATVGQSLKWITMAKTNMSILRQLAAQHPLATPGTNIVLRYAKADRRHRFPDGFGTWSFPYAVKLFYKDPTLNGEILPQDSPAELIPKNSEVIFTYQSHNTHPQVVKIEGR